MLWCSSKNTIVFENKYSGADFIPFTGYFQTFYDSVLNKFSSIKNTSVNECIIYKNFSSSLEETLDQVMAALSKKTPEDSLLLYFSICYLNELKRLAKGGWKFRCYNSPVTCTEKGHLSNKGNLEQNKSKDCSDKNLQENGVGIEELQRSATLVDIVNIENKIIKGNEENGMASRNHSGESVEKDAVANDKDNVNESIMNVNNDIENGPQVSEIKQNGLSTVSLHNKVGDVDKINENTPIMNLTNVKNGMSSPSLDGTVQAATANNICNKSDEAPLTEHPNENGESKETSPTESIDEYEHLQCWSDVSLCYVLAEYFVSVNCKDEYTFLFYLKKCLNYLDSSIANISRQQSAKSAQKNESKEAPKVIKNDSANEVKLDTKVIQNGDKLQQETIAASSLKGGDITVAVEENNSNKNVMDCAIFESDTATGENKIESVDGDSAVIENEVSDNAALENNDECNTDKKDKSEMDSCSSVIDSTLSVIESTFSIIEKIEKKNEDSTPSVPSEKIEESQLTSQKVSEKLQAEHKDICEKINLLNTVVSDIHFFPFHIVLRY